MLINVFHVEFEICATTEVRCHYCYFTLKGRCLNTKVTLLRTVLMCHSACEFLKRKELFGVEKVINLSFTFEEYNNGSLFAINLFNTVDNSCIEFKTMHFLKLNHSPTVQPINWRHDKSLLHPILLLHNTFLSLGNMLQCSSHTQNRIEIGGQTRVWEMRNDQIHRYHLPEWLITYLLVRVMLVVIGEYCTVPVVDEGW